VPTIRQKCRDASEHRRELCVAALHSRRNFSVLHLPLSFPANLCVALSASQDSPSLSNADLSSVRRKTISARSISDTYATCRMTVR
jgi:hypothetical protein